MKTTIVHIILLLLIVFGCKNDASPLNIISNKLSIGVFDGEGVDDCCESKT